MPADNMQANMASQVTKVGQHTFSFRVALAGITAADIITQFKPGFKFAIEKTMFIVQSAVTTAGDAADIVAKISGNAITGGTISLTSANATPKGKVIEGTEVTGGAANDNYGDEDDTISLAGENVTAFAEGDGEIVIILRNRESGIPG